MLYHSRSTLKPSSNCFTIQSSFTTDLTRIPPQVVTAVSKAPCGKILTRSWSYSRGQQAVIPRHEQNQNKQYWSRPTHSKNCNLEVFPGCILRECISFLFSFVQNAKSLVQQHGDFNSDTVLLVYVKRVKRFKN